MGERSQERAPILGGTAGIAHPSNSDPPSPLSVMTATPCPAPVEAFDCPCCEAGLMPPVCCCGRPHNMILSCPDCGWKGERIVTRGQQTTVMLTIDHRSHYVTA
jgi:hypothetical protein